MARLIEVQDVQTCPSLLPVNMGDVLLFHATGGQVRSGADVVELVGTLLSAVVGNNGTIVTPAGAPNTVLFRAQRPGRAIIDVVTGDPWRGPQATTLHITVAS